MRIMSSVKLREKGKMTKNKINRDNQLTETIRDSALQRHSPS